MLAGAKVNSLDHALERTLPGAEILRAVIKLFYFVRYEFPLGHELDCKGLWRCGTGKSAGVNAGVFGFGLKAVRGETSSRVSCGCVTCACINGSSLTLNSGSKGWSSFMLSFLTTLMARGNDSSCVSRYSNTRCLGLTSGRSGMRNDSLSTVRSDSFSSLSIALAVASAIATSSSNLSASSLALSFRLRLAKASSSCSIKRAERASISILCFCNLALLSAAATFALAFNRADVTEMTDDVVKLCIPADPISNNKFFIWLLASFSALSRNAFREIAVSSKRFLSSINSAKLTLAVNSSLDKISN